MHHDPRKLLLLLLLLPLWENLLLDLRKLLNLNLNLRVPAASILLLLVVLKFHRKSSEHPLQQLLAWFLGRTSHAREPMRSLKLNRRRCSRLPDRSMIHVLWRGHAVVCVMGIARREIEARRSLAEIFQQAKRFRIRDLQHLGLVIERRR